MTTMQLADFLGVHARNDDRFAHAAKRLLRMDAALVSLVEQERAGEFNRGSIETQARDAGVTVP